MSRACVRTIGRSDPVLEPEIVRLNMSDDRVLRLPFHMPATFREQDRLSNSKAMGAFHGHPQ